jgi:phosphoglycerate dehydrogenase-like enzyme
VKVLVASAIDPDTLACLENQHDVAMAINASEDALCRAGGDIDVLIFRSGVQITAKVMQAAPRLGLLVRAGSGLDNVDVQHARRTGIRLVRVAGSSAEPVAELTFGLLLSLARNVALADRLLRRGNWPKSKLGGPLLHGKTIGIVGAGNIGTRVGEMGSAWGMRAIGCVADPSETQRRRLAARGVTLTTFDEVLEQSEFVCLHVPLTARTRHMISDSELTGMKQGAFLVNVARGGVVDEEALLRELTGDAPRIAGAALDVHEAEGEGTMSPLRDLPNVVLTPHIGAMATDSQRLIGLRVLELMDAFSAGDLDAVVGATELVS